MVKDNENNVSNLHNLKRIVRLIWNKDKKYLFVTLISVVILGITPGASLIIMQRIINYIQVSEIFNKILLLIFIYVSIDLFQLIFQSLVGYYNNRFSLAFNLEVRKKILTTASNLDLKFYEDSEVYDLIRRAQDGSENKLLLYFSLYITIANNIIILVTYLLILLQFAIWILPVIMLLPVIDYFISNYINKKQFNIVRARTNKERKAWYYSYIISSGISYKDLKIYNLFKYFIKSYENYRKTFILQDLKILKERLLKKGLIQIFDQLLNGALFIYIVYIGYIGKILIGDVITYVRAVMSIKNQIQIILSKMSDVRKESLYISQLFEFIDIDTNNNVNNKGIIIQEINNISIKNLYFKFKPDQEYVLKDITLELKKDNFYMMVGKNGSGKTTLAKIIMGFYDDYEGEFLVNGIDFRLIDKDIYMKKIGAVFQDYTKFEASFRENIAYGNLEIINDDPTIIEAIKNFELLHILNNSEKYLDTQLGYWFDSGKQLSAGEWQKIALARSYVKNNWDLLFLDEPNAAMDSITELKISELYKDLFKNRIGVIIAHRTYNLVKDADMIFVLDKGNLIAQGNHEELINKNEIYRKLYYSQNQVKQGVS